MCFLYRRSRSHGIFSSQSRYAESSKHFWNCLSQMSKRSYCIRPSLSEKLAARATVCCRCEGLTKLKLVLRFETLEDLKRELGQAVFVGGDGDFDEGLPHQVANV